MVWSSVEEPERVRRWDDDDVKVEPEDCLSCRVRRVMDVVVVVFVVVVMSAGLKGVTTEEVLEAEDLDSSDCARSEKRRDEKARDGGLEE